MTRNGKWTCSTNEERWDHGEEFDTREEAEAYARADFGSDQGLEHGRTVWVGQIKEITAADLAQHGADAWRVIENLDERLYELVGDEVAHELTVTKEQERDLDERLTATIRDWMIAHGIEPSCWQIEHVKELTWRQCDVMRAVPDAAQPTADASERCVRHDGHDGECEWP